MSHVLELFRNLKINKKRHEKKFEVATSKFIAYCLFLNPSLNITSGCPWPKATVKSPVGESVAERNRREKGRVIERMGKEGGSQNQSR